ncbi:unnamed protein product [Absidia cylindrospora]
MTPEEMANREFEAKKRKLADSELVQTSAQALDEQEDSAAKNDTFVNQLVAKIMNNLQFSVTNIHVRYEDDVSTPDHRFAAGITLSELSAITTDENWVPQTIGDVIHVIHKLATLESLSIYWNTDARSLAYLEEADSKCAFQRLIATNSNVPDEHQYILKPVSGTGRIKLNKSFGSKIPKIDVTLLFDELAFVIDNEQYRDAILLLDLFHSYLKKQKYQHLHPPSDMTPKRNPREYFRFAGNAVLSKVHERNARWSWARLKERRDDRHAFLECYVANKLDKATEDQIARLDFLERKLSYEDLRFYQSIAKNRLKREKAVMAAEEKRRKELDAAARAEQGSQQGWISSWWYGQASKSGNGDNKSDEALVITDEQRQEFYDAIEYDEDKASITESIEIPKDTMLLSLRTSLNKGSFTIKRDPHAHNSSELVSLVFDSVMLGSTIYVESWKASASLGDLRLYDGVTENTRYHQLVGVSRKHLVEEGDISALVIRPFFSIEYEYCPLDKRADNAITLVMRNIDIVYNPIIIKEILAFFRPPETSIDSVNALVEVAGDTLEDIKKQTKSTLTFALEQHTTLDLHVDMDAPIIVIPECCTSQMSRGIVLDAGHINIESQLVSPETVSTMKSKRASDYTSDDHLQLRSLMYDRFTMKLTQTKILVDGVSVDKCLQQVRNPQPELNYLHMVDRIDMTFLLELCILEASPELSKFKMSGHLPILRINFSDTKYRAIMQLPHLMNASGLFGQDDQDESDFEEMNAGDHGGSATNANAKRHKLMNLKLWNQEEDAFSLDTESDDGAGYHFDDDINDDNHGDNQGHITPPTSITTSSGTHRAKKSVKLDQKQFELDFRVDKVLANIYHATTITSEKDRPPEKLLAVLSLHGLSLEYLLRPYDMTVDLTLEALDVIDRMPHGDEFKYLVTSDHDILDTCASRAHDDDSFKNKDLVQLHYIQVDKKSPEYVDKYKGIDRTVHLTLSTLNFIVTRSSVLTLYNYAISTFVDPEQQRQRATSPQNTRRKSTSFELQQQQQTPQNARVDLFLDSVNFILNNDGSRIATGELSHGDLLIMMVDGKTKVQSKFANFTLTDDSAKRHGSSEDDQHQLLTIQGDELIDLRYETFVKEQGDSTYPGYDQSLFLRMGSAQFTFLEKPVCELLLFLSKFAAMKTIYDRARQAAFETAQQQYNTLTKMHFDVVIRTPVVLFPEIQQQHTLDVVVAHLGEIWASNSFITQQDKGCINCVKAGLRAMNLTSRWHFVSSGDEQQVQLQTLPIIDNIDLNLDIVIPHADENGSSTGRGRAGIDVTGDLGCISMNLTERQYKFLLDATQMVSRVLGQIQHNDPTENVANEEINLKQNDDVDQRILSQQEEKRSPGLNTSNSNDTLPEPPRFRVSLKMPTIKFEVYTDLRSSTLSTPISLSRFALNNSSLLVHGQDNGSIDIRWQVHTLTVDDTRPDIHSQFKHIVPSIQHGHQFLMQCDLSAPTGIGGSRHGIVLLTINEPKMIVSLDHVFMVYKFFTTPTADQRKKPPPKLPRRPPHHLQQSPQQTHKQSSRRHSSIGSISEEEPSLELSYRLNVTDVEFILLADPDTVDSEAVVLSTEKIMISHQSVMALAVKKMGMFLCRMDSRDTSTLRFIQPFDISISMNNNSLSNNVYEEDSGLIELEVDVEALVLRLSYRDAMLVTSIFNKAYDLYHQYIMAISTESDPGSSGMSYAQTILDQAANGVLQLPTQTKESLRATFQGMQIILIEEVHEFPMIDMTLKPFEVVASNWSKSFSSNVCFSTYINYFNIKNSHWEPLIEPWQFDLRIAREVSDGQQPLNIKIVSNNDLNVNVSHTFLESAMTTIVMFDKQNQSNYCGERGHESPYKLKNRTGYPIHVWNNSNESSPAGEVTVSRLEDGKDLPWWFEDWRKRREMTETVSNILNVQLEGALWETLRNAHVDTEGEHIYTLRPLIRNVQHRIVFDVKLVDNVKVVTIRSAMVIENRTLLPVDVALLDSRGYADGTFVKIAPGEDYPLPIEKAFHNRFCIRPDAGFGYKWTGHAIHWTDFVKNDDYKTTISCISEENNDMPPFIFQIFARHDKTNALYGRYCAMAIRLSAPVEIENLLPYDFNFRIIDKTSGQDYNSFLRKGGSIPLHVVENKHLLLLNIHIPNTVYKASEFAIISTRGVDDLDIDDTIQLTDSGNNYLTLKINTVDIVESGGAHKYSIFCPYIIINKTGCPISLKPKLAWQNSMFNSQTSISVSRPAKKPEPFMYSYPKYDNRNRSLIQTSGSEWSQPLSFEAVRAVYDVSIPTPSQSEEFHIGINVQEGIGKYKVTKMVTLTPRFILSNHMNVSIRYREPESRVDQEVEPHGRTPLYRIRKSAEKQLCIKLPGINNVWSSPFNIQDLGKVHVRLNSADGATIMLMRVTTILEDATIFIVLEKEAGDEWPYLLVNRTNEDMTFYQEDPMPTLTSGGSGGSHQFKTSKTKLYTLPAQTKVPYSWDMPAVKDKKIVLNIHGRERSINTQEIGSQLPFRHSTKHGQQAITSIDIKTHGSRQIIQLFPFSQGNSLFRPSPSDSNSLSAKSSTSSPWETSIRDGFETIDIKPIINVIFQVKLSHIGISVVNRQLQELMYASFKGMDIKVTDSNMYQSLRWNIRWLQIDNQLYGTLFPILLYPTNMTKEAGQDILPTFQLALDRVKDDSHGVLYFKYFSVLLQELSLEMDEEFIYAILDFSHLDVNGWNTNLDDSRVWEYSTEIPDAKPQEDVALLYFEVLSVQPIRFDLSFLRTAQVNIVDDRNQNNSALMFFVNILTMAIGNINNAPMRFNALAIENLMASRQDLSNRIFIHYSDQFVYQIHRMLGSADFLGNPVGLFNNLSSGVAELFYEPWQGLIMSDRPQDLGMGIARGVSGFVRKSVFGVTDSFTKFTGSIGKGLSAATMDREYQERRRMNMARNKPRHALVGMAQGANYFANSLASGVTGLVTQPIDGASREGVGGFFAGVGKGLVGAVTKPVVGVFDLASNVTEGIRNTTTPTDTNDIERIRHPRFIGDSGVLKVYIKGGKYSLTIFDINLLCFY